MTLALTLTTAGLQALVNASATGSAAVQIATVGITQQAFAPAANLAAVPNELERLASVGGQVVSPSTIHVTVQDNSQAVYNVYGFGVYLADGTLLGTYSQPGLILGKTAASIFLLAIDILLGQGLASNVTFGATNFLDPPASETVVGVTRYSTVVEAKAGQSNAAAVHPQGLAAALAALGLGPLATPQGVSALAALLSVLGYTPVNKAGDAISGPISITTPGAGSGLFVSSSAGSGHEWGYNANSAFYDLHTANPGSAQDYDARIVATGPAAPTGPGQAGLSYIASAHGFNVRPSFAGATPWDSANFNPLSYQLALGFTPLNKASNLADLASVPTARGNLGLGPLSTQAGATPNAAAVAALGFTPLNKAGDTMSGPLSIGGFQIGSNSAAGFYSDPTNIAIRALNAPGSVIFVQSYNGAVTYATFGAAGANFSVPLTQGGNQVWHAGNLTPGPLATQAGASASAAVVAALGYTPVQQGGAPSQQGNPLELGWDGSHLRLGVGDADQGELAFLAELTAAQSALNAAIAGKQPSGNYQPALGFAPVQQGGGPGQGGNKIDIGWSGARLKASVDGGDLGAVVFDSELLLARALGPGVTPGYQLFPGGFILQWGFGTLPANAGASVSGSSVTFPIAFPNSPLGGFAQGRGQVNSSLGWHAVCSIDAISASGMSIEGDANDNSISWNNNVPFWWFAYGY